MLYRYNVYIYSILHIGQNLTLPFIYLFFCFEVIEVGDGTYQCRPPALGSFSGGAAFDHSDHCIEFETIRTTFCMSESWAS